MHYIYISNSLTRIYHSTSVTVNRLVNLSKKFPAKLNQSLDVAEEFTKTLEGCEDSKQQVCSLNGIKRKWRKAGFFFFKGAPLHLHPGRHFLASSTELLTSWCGLHWTLQWALGLECILWTSWAHQGFDTLPLLTMPVNTVNLSCNFLQVWVVILNLF